VVRTRVGYAGGTQKDPTYYNLGDHTETIQIDYDPTQVTYEELLSIFWDSHNPAKPPFSVQYKSIIFYHNEEQKRLALETKARVEAELKASVLTEIIPASEFYLAEAYHQKYYLQGVPQFKQEFGAIYPSTDDFIASTSAARVNGYLGGNGTVASLQAEIESFGLSPEAKQKLLDIVSSLKN
jgi:peptide-methionine (S)-S-oxide reductase